MNSFFDEYVKASTGLKQFIENSQKALEAQYLREIRADYETEYKERRLLYNSYLEAHASTIYTKEIFRCFQDEILKSGSYIVKRAKGSESYIHKVYLVENTTVLEDCRTIYTLMASMDGKIECTYKKFEHSGMICRHIIRYLNKKQRTYIPEECITLRWKMNSNKVMGPLPYTPPLHLNVVVSQAAMYSSLCNAFQSLGAIGSYSVQRYHHVMNAIAREKHYMMESFPEEERKQRMNELFHHDGQDDSILNPPRSTTKGRPKAGIFKSGIETSTLTKQQTCK